MITRVNTVLIGATCPASYTTADALAVGNVALFDGNKKLITAAADAADIDEAYIGVCRKKETITLPDGTTTVKAIIEYSNKLDKSEYFRSNFNAYTAPVQQTITIDFSGMTKAVIGHRYVLRLVYKDLYEAPGQFTHTYEVVATSESVSALAGAFLAKINKHLNRRVDGSIYAGVAASKTIGGIGFQAVNVGDAGNDITVQIAAAGTASVVVTGNAIVITPATGSLTLAAIQAQIAGSTAAAALIKAVSGTSASTASATALEGGVDATLSTLLLTAKAKDDNEGVNSINEYSVVDVNASVYYTIPGVLLSNQPEAVSGVTITKTTGNPGKGYWKQVRDMEVRAMGYKGHVFTGAYPTVEQARLVEEGATYDSFTIEHDNKHLTPDNQTVKEAPLMESIYVKAGQIANSVFEDALDAFTAGSVA